MAETIEKISDTEIKISEPIVKMDVFDVNQLKLEKESVAAQISGVNDQLRTLRLRQIRVDALIQKAKDVGVEVKPVEVEEVEEIII